MGRNHLAHRAGDAINAVLAAVGYNFRLLIRWLRFLLQLLPHFPILITFAVSLFAIFRTTLICGVLGLSFDQATNSA